MMAIFLPHVALQVSGFAFDIPQKRYRDGFRIWPQYRWEGLVFVARTMALMGVAWHRKLHGCSYETFNIVCSVWLPVAVVMAASMGADVVSKLYRRSGRQTNTLRDLNEVPPGLIYLAASAQFHANVHCLLNQDQLCVQFAALMVIQLTAFFMTLRRKGVINAVPEGMVLYGTVLIVGMGTIIKDYLRRDILGIGLTLGNVAALLRFNGRLNKYVLWTGIALLIQVLSTMSFNGVPSDATMGGRDTWRVSAVLSFGVLLAGAARRRNQLAKNKCFNKTIRSIACPKEKESFAYAFF